MLCGDAHVSHYCNFRRSFKPRSWHLCSSCCNSRSRALDLSERAQMGYRLGMENVLASLGIGSAQLFVILEVVVAMALGGLIGYDRQLADKPAGIRTHMLVAGASALFVGLGN